MKERIMNIEKKIKWEVKEKTSWKSEVRMKSACCLNLVLSMSPFLETDQSFQHKNQIKPRKITSWVLLVPMANYNNVATNIYSIGIYLMW